MKIAVMGSGGVGGYFGARLALAGEDVTFIARDEHLLAMRENGLKVFSGNGDMLVQPVNAVADAGKTGPVDIVIFAVKLWDTDTAAEACRPLIGPETAVISFQNGVEAADRVAAILGAEHTMGGVAHIASLIEAPGVIRHTGAMARLTFGELDGKSSGRGEDFLAACERAGFEAALSGRIVGEIWKKFVFLSAMAGATAVTRCSIGPILADADTRAMFASLMEEAAAVGRAQGIALAGELTGKLLDFAGGLPVEMKASMLGDLERGNRLELPWLSGAVVRMGRELSVPTPVTDTVYAALKPHAEG